MTTAVDIFLRAKKEYLSKRGGTPDPASPSKMIPQTTFGEVVAFGMTFAKFVEAGDFVHTDSYERAFRTFSNAIPNQFAGAIQNNPAITNSLWPNNVQFWNAGLNLAIARGGAGLVLSNWEVAKESVAEAVKELPGNLANIVKHVPGFGLVETVVRWSIVAGAGFLLWKLYQVYESKHGKREELGP